MKAKDLAALAALGVAGYAAYNKFGKKSPANSGAKAGAKLGDGERDSDAGESNARMNMRDMNEGSGRRDAGGNTEKQSRQELDVPEALSRQELDIPNRVSSGGGGMRPSDVGQGGSQVATSDAYKKLKAAGANSKTPAAALKDYVAPRTVAKPVAAAPAAADAVADDYVMPRTAPKQVMPDANRVKAYNPDIMYNTTVPLDTSIAHNDKMNQAAYSRNKKAGVIPSQMPDDAAAARITRQSKQSGEAAAIEKAAKEAAINAQAKARLLRQGTPSTQVAAPQQSRYTKDRYGNIIDNTTGKVSRTIFSAGQEGNAARVGMKRGGVVKMASGGMTSSKMSSKPSTASSRGDGIAQRGKTRGKMC